MLDAVWTTRVGAKLQYYSINIHWTQAQKSLSLILNKKDPFTAGVCFIHMPQRMPDNQQLTTISNHNQQ